MRRCFLPLSLALFVLLGAASPAPARAEPKVVLETWHAAYFEGVSAGHVHTTVHEIKRGGATLYRTTRALNLKLRRYNNIVPLRLELGSEEQADGKAVGLWLTQIDDRGTRFTQTGTVEEGKLVLRTPRDPVGKKLPWNGDVLGLYKQDLIFKDRKVKVGERFAFAIYELAAPASLTVRALVKGEETTDQLESSTVDGKTTTKRVPVKLLRVELLADKLTVGETSIQLPRQVTWLDKDRLPVRYEWAFPGLGRITLLQTTKEVATKPGLAPEQLPDIGLNSIIKVAKVIESPYATRSAVYRITVKDDDDPGTTFARDGRQTVQNLKGSSFELHVKAWAPRTKAGPPGKAFLERSHFLDCDNLLIEARAKALSKDEFDPLRQAQVIEKWAHDNMKGSSGIGLARASRIMKDLTGDCRQHAMLTAALCRAAKLPARTAVGLLYVPVPGGKGELIFHMWTEVWANGRWVGLDATLGQGKISACHIKVADHNWSDTRTLAPLLPVARVLGKVEVEVIEAR